jgi:segregation and condensation protein A
MKQTNNVNLIEDIEDDSYKFKLENFQGPLDLLLHLIKGSKLDIHEINLSEITEQYLVYMKELDGIDMEKAAEFIEVAATLIEIKSRAVLPREEELSEDEEDPESLLLRRLQEYKVFKDAGEKLTVIENVDRFYKEPSKSAHDYRIVLKQMNMDNLVGAFSNLLHKIDQEAETLIPKTIMKDRFTVEEKTFELRASLITKKKLTFSELVEEDYSRTEVITVFLALLEMLKMQEITVEQNDKFAEIEIIRCEDKTSEEE